MKTICFIALAFFLSSPMQAQYLDSLKYVVRGKANIDLRYESRWSFIDNGLINIRGIRVGAAFEKKLRMGLGLSWLKTNISNKTEQVNESGNIETVIDYFKLGYLSTYVDVVFYKTKRWQLSVPIQIGTGFTWIQNQEKYKLNNMQAKQFLFLYEPGVTVQYKLAKWTGIGMEVAYRFVLKNNNNVSKQLSSPTYAFKYFIWIDQLYYLLAPESKWSTDYGPASW